MCRRAKAEIWGAKPIARVMLGMHPGFAEIGDFIVQEVVLLGTAAEDVVIAKGIVVAYGLHLALFDLLG